MKRLYGPVFLGIINSVITFPLLLLLDTWWKCVIMMPLIVIAILLSYRAGLYRGGEIVKKVWNIPGQEDK